MDAPVVPETTGSPAESRQGAQCPGDGEAD